MTKVEEAAGMCTAEQEEFVGRREEDAFADRATFASEILAQRNALISVIKSFLAGDGMAEHRARSLIDLIEGK